MEIDVSLQDNGACHPNSPRYDHMSPSLFRHVRNGPGKGIRVQGLTVSNGTKIGNGN
jgi:hypothetical protein